MTLSDVCFNSLTAFAVDATPEQVEAASLGLWERLAI